MRYGSSTIFSENIKSFCDRKFRVFTERNIDEITQLKHIPEDELQSMKIVAMVFPFRVNNYVIDELINWENIPADPIYQLTFPQKGMLTEDDFNALKKLIDEDASVDDIQKEVKRIRFQLNPHPAGQLDMNVPRLDGEPLFGMQHKYNETVLFFPSQGQVCHSFCTFCFRWAQFIGESELRFGTKEADSLHRYLRENKQVTDLLMTGGDPMVMKTKYLENYLTPLLSSEYDHIQSIRFGTKALTFWPHRFVTDSDADSLIALIKKLIDSGKHVAVMAHFNHWQEFSTPVVREAIKRLRDAGVEIRSQAPLVANINDSADIWIKMWKEQVRLGIIPYYMFVERDTGAKAYFELPIVKAWEIYKDAISNVSGLSRTARGPSMSAGPGKVEIQGVATIKSEKVIVLRFIQARNHEWVQKPFFAKYDENATWLDQLKPAFGEEKFFFEEEYEHMQLKVSENSTG
ncbi:MAG: lysine 2,3-aminomutase [Gammaproteobacteria bacterium]|nr:MAG: lysine 2,3-aminomutase [Gammaproteobacteria bacterium]